MKKLFFIVFVLTGTLGYAQAADSLFVEANELYRQEKYAEALKSYEEIENMELESWALYYNMGNIYYRMNQVAPAIYYYEKALVLSPENRDVLPGFREHRRQGSARLAKMDGQVGGRHGEPSARAHRVQPPAADPV